MGVQYEVNLAGVRSVINQQQGLSTSIAAANLSILQAQTMLRITMSSIARGSIDFKLSRIRRQLEAESRSARKMNSSLLEIIGLYEAAERQAMDAQENLSSDQATLADWLSDFWHNALGNTENTDDNNSFVDFLKKVEEFLNKAGKLTDSDGLGLAGKFLGLLVTSFSDIANSTPQELFGNVSGYISDSFSFLDKISEMLKENTKTDSEKLGLTKFGLIAGVGGSIMGFVEDLSGVVEKWTSTTGDTIDRFASGTRQLIESMGSAADVGISINGAKQVLDAINSGNAAKIAAAKNVVKSTGSWLTLANTIASTIGSGAEATIQLGADGNLSGTDQGEILVTGSVNGLDTLISGVTHGIISCETAFGKDADAVVNDLKSWTSDIANNASSYIKQDPERLKEYNEAGPFKQSTMMIKAIFEGNTKENRTVVPGHNIEPGEGVLPKVIDFITNKVPLMGAII